MEPIEYHKKRISKLTDVIEAIKAISFLQELDMQYDPLGIDLIVARELIERNKELLKFYSQQYQVSEEFLIKHGIDPFPAMSKKELKEFKKQYPDPYRLRVPEYIRKPFINFFKRIFIILSKE